MDTGTCDCHSFIPHTQKASQEDARELAMKKFVLLVGLVVPFLAACAVDEDSISTLDQEAKAQGPGNDESPGNNGNGKREEQEK